jgi:hypothetical protein
MTNKVTPQESNSSKLYFSLDPFLREAYKQFDSGEFSKVIIICAQIITQKPENMDALRLSAFAGLKLKHYSLAMRIFHILISKDICVTCSCINIGSIIHLIRRKKDAVQLLKTASEKDPGNSLITGHLNLILNFPDKPLRQHSVVAGVGRSGTTFIMQLLTKLGLDTSFTAHELDNDHDLIDPNSHGGLEVNILSDDAPYFIKSVLLHEIFEELQFREDIKLDYTIIPMRDLEAAAESRRSVHATNLGSGGGLTGTPIPEEQKGVETISKNRINTTD